jgi:hypothetical protein
LQVIGCQRRTKAAATIEDNLGFFVWDHLLDVPLDNAFAEVNGADDVAGLPLRLFPHVDQIKGIPLQLFLPDLLDCQLLDAAFGLVDQS